MEHVLARDLLVNHTDTVGERVHPPARDRFRFIGAEPGTASRCNQGQGIAVADDGRRFDRGAFPGPGTAEKIPHLRRGQQAIISQYRQVALGIQQGGSITVEQTCGRFSIHRPVQEEIQIGLRGSQGGPVQKGRDTAVRIFRIGDRLPAPFAPQLHVQFILDIPVLLRNDAFPVQGSQGPGQQFSRRYIALRIDGKADFHLLVVRSVGAAPIADRQSSIRDPGTAQGAREPAPDKDSELPHIPPGNQGLHGCHILPGRPGGSIAHHQLG